MIPYTVDRRPDTGVTNVTMGIWLFLASEVMLFGAMFSSYALLRASAPVWPLGRNMLNLPLGLINTVVLVAGSVAVYRARTAVTARTRPLLLLGSLAAVAFLVIKGVEYAGEISVGLVPRTSTALAMYYLLTGAHALHVFAGLIANLWVLTGLRGRVSVQQSIGRLGALSLYWVFVDVVWIAILISIYLL